MLLESSVARVLLNVAADPECSCAHDCLATGHEKTRYPPRTSVVFCLLYLVAIQHFISDLCTAYCVACDIRRAHGRGARSSETTATTGVRVPLEASIARVPLGAAAAADDDAA